MPPPPTGRCRTTRNRRTRRGGVAVSLVALALAPGSRGAVVRQSVPWLDRVALDTPPAAHWLPARLREISGLALTDDGRLLTHDDERAVVYEVDARGTLRKGFGLGDPIALGDFEGIATARGLVYLVTSDGMIYETSEGGSNERTRYEAYDTGLGGRCEVEGLAFDPDRDALLLACKNLRDEALEGSVAIFGWSFVTRSIVPHPILVDMRALTGPIGVRRFQPSGIARVEATGTYLLLAGPQAAVAEISPTGDVLTVRRLDPTRHPQAEGIAVTADGRLAIADEGGDGRGRITIYATRPDGRVGAGTPREP
jgi:hypothetical protein